MSKSYNILRIPCFIDEEGMEEQLFERLNKISGAVDEVMFFNQSTHAVRPVEEMQEFSKRIKPVLEKVRKTGIKAGLDILCTIGHHGEYVSDLGDMDYFYDNPETGALCMRSQKTLDYIKEIYKAAANALPDSIYIDDDMDYQRCGCKKCIENFKKEYDIKLAGETLEELQNDKNEEIRKKVRSAWIDYNRKSITKVFEAIEKTVHSVNPKIKIGFMTCVDGMSGFGENEWTEALSAAGDEVVQRPGGGAYNDNDINAFMTKAHNIGRQIWDTPEKCDIYSEIENFPYMVLDKSVRMTSFEVLLYLAAGCNGTTYNIMSWDATDLREYDNLTDEIAELKKPSDSIVSVLGKEKAKGIGIYLRNDIVIDSGKEHLEFNPNYLHFADEIYNIGLPAAYSNENISVYLLNGALANDYSDNELKHILSAGVYMDADALDVLNKRGFGEFTGFESTAEYKKDTYEKYSKHSFNPQGSYKRNGRQTFPWGRPAKVIKKTCEGAEYISELYNYDKENLGACGGIYENKSGGRVCVYGYFPFNMCSSYPRSFQLKNIMMWLSKNSLPAYAASFNKLAVWCRGGGAAVANISFDTAKNWTLYAESRKKTLDVILWDGEKLAEKSAEKDGDVYKMPDLPPFTIAWMKL